MDDVFWCTASACASVRGSCRVRPLTPDSATKLVPPFGTKSLKVLNHEVNIAR